MVYIDKMQEYLKILQDLTNLKDGLCLINIWLRNRNISMVDELFILAFLCHLLKNRQIHTSSSALQIFRVFLTGLGNQNFYCKLIQHFKLIIVF